MVDGEHGNWAARKSVHGVFVVLWFIDMAVSLPFFLFRWAAGTLHPLEPVWLMRQFQKASRPTGEEERKYIRKYIKSIKIKYNSSQLV